MRFPMDGFADSAFPQSMESSRGGQRGDSNTHAGKSHSWTRNVKSSNAGKGKRRGPTKGKDGSDDSSTVDDDDDSNDDQEDRDIAKGTEKDLENKDDSNSTSDSNAAHGAEKRKNSNNQKQVENNTDPKDSADDADCD